MTNMCCPGRFFSILPYDTLNFYITFRVIVIVVDK